MSTFARENLPNPAVTVTTLIGLLLAVLRGVFAGQENIKVAARFVDRVCGKIRRGGSRSVRPGDIEGTAVTCFGSACSRTCATPL